MLIFFSKFFFHKKLSLLVPDRSWTIRTGTIFKDDFSSFESLNPYANGTLRYTVGFLYMSIQRGFPCDRFPVSTLRTRSMKSLGFGIDFFSSGTVAVITFLITSNNSMADDTITTFCMVLECDFEDSPDTSFFLCGLYSLQMAGPQTSQNEHPSYHV